MVRFLKYILSKIFKKSNHNVTVTITKFAIKKTVYIKEDSTSKPSEQE